MAPVLSELRLQRAMIMSHTRLLRKSLNGNAEERQEETAGSELGLYRPNDVA